MVLKLIKGSDGKNVDKAREFSELAKLVFVQNLISGASKVFVMPDLLDF
jgi:hypothetical protein